jgi:hypothetical protein
MSSICMAITVAAILVLVGAREARFSFSNASMLVPV